MKLIYNCFRSPIYREKIVGASKGYDKDFKNFVDLKTLSGEILGETFRKNRFKYFLYQKRQLAFEKEKK